MGDIGSLIVRIGADASALQKTFDQLQQDGRQFQQALSNVGQAAATAFVGMVAGAVAATIEVGRIAEQFDQLSQRTGIAVDALEGWRVSLARNGLQAESLSTAFKTLSKDMAAMATTGASASGALEALGIGAETSMKGADAVLRAVADRFKELPDGAEKARLAVELFGKAGLQLIPMLNQGAAGLDAAIKKSAEFGLVLTQTQRGALTTFDDAMDDLGSALLGFRTQVGAAFAPALTVLIQNMTGAVVWIKDTFNAFADAGEKLSIRLAALMTVTGLLSDQILSFSVFSKQAWQSTLEQVKAVDAWAAGQLKAVDASRQKAAAETLAAGATAAHGAAMVQNKAAAEQEALGYSILIENLTKLREEKSKGYAQEQLGQFQAMKGIEKYKKKVADAAEASRLTFQDEVGGINTPAAGSTAFVDYQAQREQALGRSALLSEQYAQREAQAWVDAYMLEEKAMLDRTAAEIKAGEKNQEYQGRYIVQQAQNAQKTSDFWTNSLQQMQDSATFAFGNIRTAFGNTIVGMIKGTSTLTEFFTSASDMILGTMVQLGLSLAIEWIKTNAIALAANTAGATGSAGVWAGAAAMISGALGVVTGAVMTLWTGTILPFLVTFGTLIVEFLVGIGSALGATGFGMALAVGIFVAAALVAGIVAAAMSTKFAAGGIVTGPTNALIGEAGSPEAVIPLNSRGADFLQAAFGGGGGGGVSIVVELDGKPLVKHVANHLPSMLRLKGVPA